MSKKQKRAEGVDEALSRLADMIPYGHLLAITDPTGFIDSVREEIAKLKKLTGQLPTYTDTGEPFILGIDDAFIPGWIEQPMCALALSAGGWEFYEGSFADDGYIGPVYSTLEAAEAANA